LKSSKTYIRRTKSVWFFWDKAYVWSNFCVHVLGVRFDQHSI